MLKCEFHVVFTCHELLFFFDFFPKYLFFLIFKKFLLAYSRFTMLCYFLLYSKVNQFYVYIYPLFFRFFFHIGHYRVLRRVPCAIQ